MFSSSEKVNSSELEEIYARSSSVYKQKQFKNMLEGFDVRGQQEMTFSLEEVLWIMKLKKGLEWICFLQTHSFSLHMMLTDVLETYGYLLLCFYQLFGLSF